MAEEGHPMNAGDDSDFSPAARFKFPTQREIGVHVLSEHVFCPRAALIASESGPDAGDEEPNLGPRLDLFLHFNEHLFAEGLQQAWGEMRLWLSKPPRRMTRFTHRFCRRHSFLQLTRDKSIEFSG
ncbi:MAG TPA: hypothetical protein PLY87_24040 [Planctomycetaceae bacterium]|nr:hypothetical protein [Planctomycetaceae bacterium]HQZ68191.1 hypothetical protein [Planctomycetaceae bacterium]